MTDSRSTRWFAIATIIALLIVIAGVAFWQLSPVEHLARGSQEATFIVECDFDKYRQIMVRKNATKAIVGNSGMKLLDEQIQDLELDISGDDRPLLNAIRGKTKTELSAVRMITVTLTDPQLEADQLTLKQHADVKPAEMYVQSKSIKPAGRLESYETELTAVPHPHGTEVTLSVDMNIRLDVPKLFTSRADTEVQQAAVDAITDQQASIKQFVAEHSDERIILPEFLSK